MKTIIVSAFVALLGAISIALPAGATGTFNAYFSSNSSVSKEGSAYFSINKSGSLSFQGSGFLCFGSYYTSGKCNGEQVINNPPTNSTITISGVCDIDAAFLKASIKGYNVNVVANSTGECKVAKPSVTVKVEEKKPIEETPENESNELPQTGNDDGLIVAGATVLATAAYGGIIFARRLFGN